VEGVGHDTPPSKRRTRYRHYVYRSTAIQAERVLIRLRRRSKKMTKLSAPEEYILKLAEKDLEELY
jgi:hypothetical protein